MKIGTIKVIVREELSKFGELPKWIDPFLQTMNKFINDVGLALKGNLTFKDNFLCVTKQIKLTHGVEQEINPQTKFKIYGVICLNANGLIIDKFGWRSLSNGNIGLTIYYHAGTESLCDIIIFLG